MTFYLRMAWRSLLRSRGLTLVMIAALSLGVGTWYLQHQIFVFLDGKTPDAPEGLYHVALDKPVATSRPGIVGPLIPSILLTPRDAQRAVAGHPHRVAITFGAPGLVEPAGLPAETARVRYTTRDLFSLFDIPLVAGAPWAIEGAAEAVIDERLADRAFGSAGAAIGRTLRVDGADVRVAGVVAANHFDRYHLYERFVPLLDGVYLPLALATPAGAEPDLRHAVAGEGTGYLHVWLEHPDRARLHGFQLRSAAEWRAAFRPGGTINLWPLLSALCLVTSIVNLVRMLIAKFSGRGHELGLLRAFGARRREVMGQLLLEAMLIGVFAGIVGIAFGMAMMPLAMGTIDHISGSPETIGVGAVAITLVASIGAALLAALYPAWQLSRGTPAAQLEARR